MQSDGEKTSTKPSHMVAPAPAAGGLPTPAITFSPATHDHSRHQEPMNCKDPATLFSNFAFNQMVVQPTAASILRNATMHERNKLALLNSGTCDRRTYMKLKAHAMGWHVHGTHVFAIPTGFASALPPSRPMQAPPPYEAATIPRYPASTSQSSVPAPFSPPGGQNAFPTSNPQQPASVSSRAQSMPSQSTHNMGVGTSDTDSDQGEDISGTNGRKPVSSSSQSAGSSTSQTKKDASAQTTESLPSAFFPFMSVINRWWGSHPEYQAWEKLFTEHNEDYHRKRMHDALDHMGTVLARWDHYLQEFKAMHAPHTYTPPPPGAYPFPSDGKYAREGINGGGMHASVLREGAIASLLRHILPSSFLASDKSKRDAAMRDDDCQRQQQQERQQGMSRQQRLQQQQLCMRSRGRCAATGTQGQNNPQSQIILATADMEATASSYNCWVWSLFASFFVFLIIVLASSSTADTRSSWYYSHHHDHHDQHPGRESSFLYYPYAWPVAWPNDELGMSSYLGIALLGLIGILLITMVICTICLAVGGCGQGRQRNSQGVAEQDRWGDDAGDIRAGCCPCLGTWLTCSGRGSCCGFCCGDKGDSSENNQDDYKEGFVPAAVVLDDPQQNQYQDPAAVAYMCRSSSSLSHMGQDGGHTVIYSRSSSSHPNQQMQQQQRQCPRFHPYHV